MANPTTNYGFVMPTTTDLVTDLPADFGVFGQAVDTQMLTNANAAIAKTIVDAKGDLIAATAADTVSRLAVGANNTVLTADSTAATGIKWAAASSGAMTLIKRATFSNVADTGTTFDSMFSATYSSYYIVFEVMMAGTTADDLHLQFRYAGPTTQTSAYYQSNLNLDNESATLGYSNAANAAQFRLNDNIGNNSNPDDASRGSLFVFGAAARPIISGFLQNGGQLKQQATYGVLQTARTYTGFLCKASSSNIYGTISVYGLAVA
jgi:hypothetical protein